MFLNNFFQYFKNLNIFLFNHLLCLFYVKNYFFFNQLVHYKRLK